VGVGLGDPGFSAHVGEALSPQDEQRLEDTAAYIVRNPLSLRKLVYLDGQQAVLYRSRMNPSLGRNFEALDPLEWLARMSDHMPDPGQHRTILYGQYANRVRGARQGEEAERQEASAETPHDLDRGPARARSASLPCCRSSSPRLRPPRRSSRTAGRTARCRAGSHAEA